MKHSYSNSFLVVMAFCTIAVVTAVYAYMLNAVSVAEATSLSAKDSVAAAEANKSREAAFMQAYQATSADWARLPGFFVPSSDVVSFIEALEALGPETGATTSISSISADDLDAAEAGTLGKIHAHVEIQGRWTSAMRALELAEILPFKSTVSNVHADGSIDKGGSSWVISFDITAVMIAQAASSAGTSTVSQH